MKTFLMRVLGFLLLTIVSPFILKAQFLPVEIVHDPAAEITLHIEKQIAKDNIVIKRTKKKQEKSKFLVFVSMLKNAKEKIADISQVSKFVKQMSQYKNIIETEMNIVYAYEAMQKNIIRKRQLTFSETELLYAFYESIFKDSNSVLNETKKIFLGNNKLNMYDGNRIKLLQEQEDKLKDLLGTAYAVNAQFSCVSARRINMYKELKKLKSK